MKMSDYDKHIRSLEASHSSGDQLESLKSMKGLLIELLSNSLDEDFDSRDITQITTNLTKVSMEIVKLEGLRREFSGEEQDQLGFEEAFRKVVGKRGGEDIE